MPHASARTGAGAGVRHHVRSEQVASASSGKLLSCLVVLLSSSRGGAGGCIRTAEALQADRHQTPGMDSIMAPGAAGLSPVFQKAEGEQRTPADHETAYHQRDV